MDSGATFSIPEFSTLPLIDTVSIPSLSIRQILVPRYHVPQFAYTLSHCQPPVYSGAPTIALSILHSTAALYEDSGSASVRLTRVTPITSRRPVNRRL